MSHEFGPPERIDGVVVRRLAVDGQQGVVPALVLAPERQGAGDGLLLLGHGGGQGKNHPRVRALAARLCRELDAAVLLLDGPVHGERAPRDGTEIERFRASRRALVDPDLPVRFAGDWRLAIDACRQEGVGTGRLVYVGFSMGVLLGVPVVAALGTVVAAVFGVGGVPARGGIAALLRPVFGDEVADIAEEEDDAELRGRLVLEAAARLGGTDVLMLNTRDDVVFPVANAMALFDALPGPGKRIVFWPGGHVDLPGEAISIAIDFLRPRLLGEPTATPTAGAAW